MKKRDDFVKVKMTAHAEKLAGGGPMTIVDRTTFIFASGEVQEVTKAVDWELVLKHKTDGEEPLFEVVTDSASDDASAA